MSKQYDLKKIRILLGEGFTADELRRLCYDTPAFRPVYDELASHTGKAEIVDRLIEYAERKFLLDELLTLAKEHNPTRFEKHQPFYVIVAPSDSQIDTFEESVTVNVGGLFDNKGIKIGEISFWGCVIRNVSIAMGVLLIASVGIAVFNNTDIKRLIFPEPTQTVTATATVTATPTVTATSIPTVITPTATFKPTLDTPTTQPTVRFTSTFTRSTNTPTRIPTTVVIPTDTPIPSFPTNTPNPIRNPTPTPRADAATATPAVIIPTLPLPRLTPAIPSIATATPVILPLNLLKQSH